MARRVIDNIREIADQLQDQGAEAERLGRMPDDTAKLLKAAGPIKLLQPKQYGRVRSSPKGIRRDGDGRGLAGRRSGLDLRRGGRAPVAAGVRRPEST